MTTAGAAGDGAAGNDGAAVHAQWHGLLAWHLEQYGIDARARSALRALARLPGLQAACGGWAHEFAAGLLVGEGGHHGERAEQLHAFVALFFQLPERDFDLAWIGGLIASWQRLGGAEHDPGLPMRAAHRLVCQCLEVLKRGRDSFSRLDADIALSLGAATLLACALLAHVPGRQKPQEHAQADYVPVSADAPRLTDILADVLATGQGSVAGLLAGQVDACSAAAMAVDDATWSFVLTRSLERLGEALRDKDVLCRTGRARFAIVLPDLASEAQVMLAANKAVRAFDVPVFAGGQEFRLLAHIGAAWAPAHGSEAGEVLHCANLALHEALQSGRGAVTFEPGLQERAAADSLLEEEFLRALDSGGFELHYQPQIDLATGLCTGAEALLRWPRRGAEPVPPLETIKVAERLGLMPHLTRWILHQACRAAADFAQSGAAVEIAVNLTASDIGDPELPLAVRNALDLWRVQPRLLKFELTEIAMLANEEVGARTMGSLRQLGVRTAIDDFGTGYSSVLLLRNLPLNELKLDRCFVAGAAQSHQDREIVRSLISLAHSLGLEVVAEGIEDLATLELLRDFGCDRAQGNLFSQSVPPRQFLAWVLAYEQGRQAGSVGSEPFSDSGK